MVQLNFRSKDNRYKFVEDDFKHHSTLACLWWQKLRHHPVLECVAQARALNFEQQHVEAQRGMGKETSPILTSILRHNVWFGKEPNRKATGEVLSCYIEPT